LGHRRSTVQVRRDWAHHPLPLHALGVCGADLSALADLLGIHGGGDLEVRVLARRLDGIRPLRALQAGRDARIRPGTRGRARAGPVVPALALRPLEMTERPCVGRAFLTSTEKERPMKRTATAVWNGTLKEGNGKVSTLSGAIQN